MKKKKLIVYSLLVIFIFTIILTFLQFEDQTKKRKYKDFIYSKSFKVFHVLPDVLKSSLMIFTGRRSFNNLFNDYNIKFLPETENVFLEFEKFKTSFDKNKGTTFFIETHDDKLILASKSGEFFIADIRDLKKGSLKKINQKIKTNRTNKKQNISINDILIIKKEIFVLQVTKNDECNKLEIYSSKIDIDLNFRTFKSFDECVGPNLVAGGMEEYFHKNKKGIIISTANAESNALQSKAQSNNSIMGKILFIANESKEIEIISKGHRNPQGLAVKDDLILSTEHGPRGGDEINKIIFGKNYGWPIASYGQSYKSENNVEFLSSHHDHGFQEPVYVFLSSIGISELIFLPDSFFKGWKNNVLVTSLNGRSIYRINFKDINFEDVFYMEKIFIGERIRDIKYNENSKTILLALEDSGIVGILYEKN
jgi:hypothetical protein